MQFFANLICYSGSRPKVLKQYVCILSYSISVKIKITEQFWNRIKKIYEVIAQKSLLEQKIQNKISPDMFLLFTHQISYIA